MATPMLPPLAPNATGFGLFWGLSTSNDGLKKLYMEPHPEDVAAKAKKAAIGEVKVEMKEGIDLNAAEIDPATGKVVRATLPTLKQILSATTVAKQQKSMDDDDPDALIKSASSNDAISAALTAPTNPSDTYFNVLKALVHAIRQELIPLTKNTVFAMPAAEDLGPAFPESVKTEDPEYFEKLTKDRRELAFQKGSVMTAMRRAHVAIGDELVYCFDRRAIPKVLPPVRRKASSVGPVQNRKGSVAGHAGPGSRTMGEAGLAAGSTRSSAGVGHGSVASGASLSKGQSRLLAAGLNPEIDDGSVRFQSSLEIQENQGRMNLGPQPRGRPARRGEATVLEATGDDAAGTVAGLRVGATGPGKDPPLPADAAVDTLRWTAQAAVAAEHRRARCEHVLTMLGAELAKEAGRQTRLRAAAAKYAATESRKEDPAGDWQSFLQGIDVSDDNTAAPIPKQGGSPGKNKSLRFPGAGNTGGHPLEGSKAKARGRGGATAFKASDLAFARFDVAQERAEAADSLMRVLEDYRFIPLSVAAGYLRQTLEEVDKLYGELIGARAKEAGVTMSPEEIAAHVEEMNDRVEAGEDLHAADGRSTASGGTGRRNSRGSTGMLRSAAGRTRRVVLPATKDATMVKEGGAVPYAELEDTREVNTYGPSMAKARRMAAAKVIAEERRKKNALEAEFGPGRDALGGVGPVDNGPVLDETDPTLISGLSAFNLRPFNARDSARAAFMDNAIPDPELDTGYFGNRRRGGGPGAVADKDGEGEDDDDQSQYGAKGGAGAGGADDEGGIDLDAAQQGEGQGAPGAEPEESKEAGSSKPDATAAAAGGAAGAGTPKAGSVAGSAAGGPGKWRSKSVGLGATGKSRRKSKEREEKKPDLREPAEIAAEKVFGKAAMDSKGFREVAMQLTEFNPLGSRPSWQKQMLHSYDLTMLRESTGLKLDQVKRTPKEPPDGRFSHLLGRYLKADDLRIQLAAARVARFGTAIGHNTGQG